MKKYLVPGLILILAGVYFLIEALPGVSLPFGAFFALVGAALLVGRLFARGKYGLSIAGFLLLCLGLAWALLAGGALLLALCLPPCFWPFALGVALLIVGLIALCRRP